MTKLNFIPPADLPFLRWLDHFTAQLEPVLTDYGLTAEDLKPLKTLSTDLHDKITAANNAQTQAKQAVADKNDCHSNADSVARALARRIKAHPNYSQGRGEGLGIEGADKNVNTDIIKPDLKGVDATGGKVSLSFSKYSSDGINIYCKRENDADWALLGRAIVSPFIDNRPLLQVGKPELRQYTAIYMQKNDEVGQYSDDVFINCAP